MLSMGQFEASYFCNVEMILLPDKQIPAFFFFMCQFFRNPG